MVFPIPTSNPSGESLLWRVLSSGAAAIWLLCCERWGVPGRKRTFFFFFLSPRDLRNSRNIIAVLERHILMSVCRLGLKGTDLQLQTPFPLSLGG